MTTQRNMGSIAVQTKEPSRSIMLCSFHRTIQTTTHACCRCGNPIQARARVSVNGCFVIVEMDSNAFANQRQAQGRLHDCNEKRTTLASHCRMDSLSFRAFARNWLHAFGHHQNRGSHHCGLGYREQTEVQPRLPILGRTTSFAFLAGVLLPGKTSATSLVKTRS